MKFIFGNADLENRLQLSVVKQLLEVIGKRKIIIEQDSYLSQMVDSYVFTKRRFTVFLSCESPNLAVEADDS